MCGFITVHRQITDWEWYSDLNTRSLFLHLLIVANHAPSKWRGHDILRGQRLTSYEALSIESALSVQSVRTSLNRLKSTGEITSKSTSSFTLITIVNYDTYQTISTKPNKQSSKQSNKPLTNDQQTSNNKQQCKQEKQEEQVLPSTSNFDFNLDENNKMPLKLPDGTDTKHVRITKEQSNKLKDRYREELDIHNWMDYLKKAIEKLDSYLERNSKKRKEYKDHYLVFLDWVLTDTKKKVQEDISYKRDIKIKGNN